jgi:hypothetical protein
VKKPSECPKNGGKGRGMAIAEAGRIVNIRFTSSLTDHDENTIAPALLKAAVSILDTLPIAYVIRIDTSDSQIYQHSRPLDGTEELESRREVHNARPTVVGR